MGRFKRLNDTLPYLLLAILLYAAVIELVGVWFVKDKIGYSIGLWYGAAIAMGLAYNLAKVIYDSCTLDARKRTVIVKSLLRYFAVVALLMAFGYFKFGNLYMAIIGMMGLKVAAYLVPPLARLICKLTGRTESFLGNDNSNNEIKEVTM